MTTTFKLRDSARIALAISAAFPISVYALPAGTVDFVAGTVTAQASDGRTRTLAKGAEVESGDLIATGDGRVQLRYTDGSRVSLTPGTQYRIDDYRYDGNAGDEQKGFFNLLKGGLRTITGLIGKANRQDYKITTTVATIGIRGTEFSVVSDADGVKVSTGEGLVEVCTKGGCIVLASGEAAVVIDQNGKPVRVLNQGFASTNDKPFTPSVKIDKPKDEAPATQEAPPPGIPGYAFALAGETGGTTSVYGSGTATITTTTGALTKYVADTSNNTYAMTIADQAQTDGTISWGSWAGGTHAAGGVNPVVDTNVHYVTGVATSAADMTAANTTNFTNGGYGYQYYTLFGATNPSIGGVVAGGAPTVGTMTVNFAYGNVLVALSGIGTANYGIDSNSLPITGSTFTGTGIAGGGSISGYTTATVSGIFTGSNAARVGVVYQFVDPMAGKVNGAAVFKPGGTGFSCNFC